MGGTLSSTQSIESILGTLVSQPCPSGHPIWSSISVKSIAQTQPDSLFSSLVDIRNKRPDNFTELVRYVVDGYSKIGKTPNAESKHYNDLINYNNALCLLFSVSGLPQKQSPWFKAPTLYVAATTPILTVLQTNFYLYGIKDDKTLNTKQATIDLKIHYTKTFLFMQHAQAFYAKAQDPSPYLQIFDTFSANTFLPAAFRIIHYSILETKSAQVLQYAKALMTMITPAIYACQNWVTALDGVNQNIIHYALSSMCYISEQTVSSFVSNRIIQSAEHIVSLFYAILVKSPAFGKFIDINDLGPQYVQALLIVFQHKYEQQKSTFFHSIILLVLSHLTSNYQSLLKYNDGFVGNFTTAHRPHRGSYVDLIIEIITNPGIDDFIGAAPLASLVCGIIANLSSSTIKLSFFSANRIYAFLNKFFSTKLAEKAEYTTPIATLLTAILQFMRFQVIGNQSLMLYGIDRAKLIIGLANANVKDWKDPARKIAQILKVADEPLRISREDEKNASLFNAVSSVVKDFNKEPEPRSTYSLSPENEVIWFDWFRVLFWQLFPGDPLVRRLRFVSFKMPTQNGDEGEPVETIEDENALPPIDDPRPSTPATMKEELSQESFEIPSVVTSPGGSSLPEYHADAADGYEDLEPVIHEVPKALEDEVDLFGDDDLEAFLNSPD